MEDNKPDYYLALRRSQKTIKSPNEDITPWLEFFLNITLAQSQAAIALITGNDGEKLLSEKQRAVLRFLQRVREATPLEITRGVNIARPTVNQAVERLIKMGLLERLGQGRGTRYRMV